MHFSGARYFVRVILAILCLYGYTLVGQGILRIPLKR